MRIEKLNDVALHWREDGNAQGLPVVFANSLGTDLRLWDQLIARLPQHLRYIRFDKRGHGLSSCPDGVFSMQDLASDTEQLLERLHVRDCCFVGLSIGGMIGQCLAHTRPDLVKALVISNSAAKMGDEDSWQARIAAIESGGIEALSEAILARWFAPEFRQKDVLNGWRAMLTRTPKAGYIGCCHALAQSDLRAQLAQLQQPTLGIAGAEDGASPVALVQETIDAIENARFEVMAGVGHLPCVEDPDAYAAILLRFLQEMDYV